VPAFRYTALDDQGRTNRGTVEGGSARQAREQLRARGLTPLEVTPMTGGGTETVARVRVSSAEFNLFARLIGGLLEAGLELEAALRATAEQAPRRAQAFYATVLTNVLQGQTLSEALASIPGMPALGVSAIAAGERSGQVAGVLSALADHGERRAQMRSRVLLALLYPIILTIVSAAVALLLVTYVVPEVTRVFEGYDRDLPWLTQALIYLSDFLRSHALAIGTIVTVSVGAVVAMLRSVKGRALWDACLSRVPGIGALRRAVDRERFADTLAMLLGGGVPLVDAVRASAGVVATSKLHAGALSAAQEIEHGRSVVDALGGTSLLSSISMQLVAAGEEGSTLEVMLTRAARFEGERLGRRLDTVLGLAEPLLILVMGGVVLLIVLAILLPIFELNTLIA
jgi:general secretion pathway protein F